MLCAEPIAPPKKKTIPGLRWYVVIMLCLASELNYFDRQTLSILAHTIQEELGITNMEYANITSAFLISYTIMYAVCGRLVDRIGTRRSFLFFVTGWSMANLLHAFARNAAQFTVFRFLLGATEPASFPAGVKAVAEWFPLKERALAIGIFNAGTAIGAALAAPIVTWIALTWGWRYAFVFGAALGFVWVAVWAIIYRLPGVHPRLSAEELAHIRSDDTPQEANPSPVSIRRVLSLKAAWGCILARMLTDPISYFFIFWTPKFLQQERGFDLADIGKYSGIPFIALALGNIAGGAIPGFLMRKGWTLNRSRKSVMFSSTCLIPICCLSVALVPNAGMAVALISLAMFAHAAWANMTIPAEVFPRHVVGSVTGFAGAMGGLMGIASQQAIGWTVEHVSFSPVFFGCAVMYPLAFIAVCVFVGKLGIIKPINP